MNDISIPSIIIMGVCLIGSAYFSATETAFLSMNKTRMRTPAEKGNKRAELALDLSDKYDKLIDGGLLPIKRWGTPQDIASAVWVLCSGALPYVTGQSIEVDGGFHIRRL